MLINAKRHLGRPKEAAAYGKDARNRPAAAVQSIPQVFRHRLARPYDVDDGDMYIGG